MISLSRLHLRFGMEHQYLFEIIPEVCALIGSKDTQRETNQCPQMNRLPWMLADFA